ncbi:hypothetical protein D3C73_1366560 [compost metagenome]
MRASKIRYIRRLMHRSADPMPDQGPYNADSGLLSDALDSVTDIANTFAGQSLSNPSVKRFFRCFKQTVSLFTHLSHPIRPSGVR